MSGPCFVRTAARSFAGGSGLFRQTVCCSSKETVTRKMSSRRQTDHLERTASVHREMELFSARVCDIMNESDSVKRLRLEVSHPDFSFRAGQWVDFFIPGVDTVGGFSICSSPGLLRREGVIELAVKNTRHPPAHWIHTKSSDTEQELQPYTINGRISEEELKRHVDPEHTLCYLCGPPPMIEKVNSDLQKVGLSEDRILLRNGGSTTTQIFTVMDASASS
ncbi:oxidoreductase NAD-binding domain-containing protein 1-like isoform X2 [Carassius auratus]|uniref:Oxidoreductase NAD-binding domain-containing protein 1 n=1 Tax=Carassius auratus TaxID=7957 RepID=A0A6P6LTG0_CARAU|nr:oxidoreductase NAD-binding domain-containing protein 1-like isoform X2 [Carassius auratus]